MADSMETPKPTTQNKKEEKRSGEPIPTLKDTTQTLRNPAFKVKDLSARTLVDRFKQFRKKDLAFVLAGLGVLFTAPMAERYLMSPTHGSSDVFKEGWGFRPGQGGLGAGGSPFDTGENGFATGNQVGENGDIITPANFRDPASLILGPEAEAQPPATTSEAPSSGSGSGSNWKNALAEAGGNAAKSALGRAGLPMPPLTLSKNMLSGIGGLSPQGGSEHYSLPPIGGGHVPNSPNVSNSLGAVKANPNLKGVGPWSERGNGTGSIEALKTAGGNAASSFSNPSAAKGLQNAAAVQMPTANPNHFGSVGADKGMGNNSVKMSKNLGESLAFMAAKMNMQKAIDLQWKLAEKKAMMWPNIEEKMLTSMITKPVDAIATSLGDSLAELTSGNLGDDYCCSSNPQGSAPDISNGCIGQGVFIKHAPQCPASGDQKKVNNLGCANPLGSGLYTLEIGQQSLQCSKMPGGSGGTQKNPSPDASSQKAVSGILSNAKQDAAQCGSFVNGVSGGQGGPTQVGSFSGSEKNAANQVCSDLKKAQKAGQDAHQAMGRTSSPQSSNYKNETSPVRGFAFNPMVSALWAVTERWLVSSARAQAQAGSSVAQDLGTSAAKLQAAIKKLQTATGNKKNKNEKACEGDVTSLNNLCNHSGNNPSGVSGVVQQLKTDCNSAFSPSFEALKKAQSDDSLANGWAGQAKGTLSGTVKTKDVGAINQSDNDATAAVTQFEGDQRWNPVFQKYAGEIQTIQTTVNTEAGEYEGCQGKIQGNVTSVINKEEKPVAGDLKSLRSDIQSIFQQQQSGSSSNTGSSADGNNDSVFCKDISSSLSDAVSQIKDLSKLHEGVKSLSGDLSKSLSTCPQPVQTAAKTAAPSQQ